MSLTIAPGMTLNLRAFLDYFGVRLRHQQSPPAPDSYFPSVLDTLNATGVELDRLMADQLEQLSGSGSGGWVDFVPSESLRQ